MPNMPRFYDANIAITAQGQYHLTPPSLTDKESIPLQVDSAGNLLVNVVVGAPGGAVTANAGTNLNTSLLALEAGGNLATVASNTNGVAKDSSLTTLDTDLKASQPRKMQDGSGNALTSTASALDVNIKSGSIANAGFNVNNFPVTQPVSGTFFQTTQPISAASLPLPSNAAQETGGNLASLVLQTRNDAQIIDVLNCILAQLKLLNLNLASAMPSAHVDSDTWVMDTLPTVQ